MKAILKVIVAGVFICFMIGVSQLVAQESEPAFEGVPITLKASDLLPGVSMTGENYRLEETVKNDGLINTYQLTTNYGTHGDRKHGGSIDAY